MGVNGQPGTAICGAVTGGGRTQAPSPLDPYRAACARRAHAAECGNATVRSPRKNAGRRTAGSMDCMESA